MVLGFEDLAAYSGLPVWLIVLAFTWSLIWKGLALWKSARKNHIVWFVAFLLIHTLGFLEILYIFLFSKINLDDKKVTKKKPRAKNKSKQKSVRLRR